MPLTDLSTSEKISGAEKKYSINDVGKVVSEKEKKGKLNNSFQCLYLICHEANWISY